MVKKADNPFIDGGLDAIALCTLLSVCSAEPANKAAVAGLTLASVALTGGDFVKADGDTNGRKVTVQQQLDMAISASGDANHVVIDNGADIYVTTCTTQTLTNGGTVTVPAWDIEISDPV